MSVDLKTITFSQVEILVGSILESKNQDEVISEVCERLLSEYPLNQLQALENEAANLRINLNFVDLNSLTRTYIAKKIISALVPLKTQILQFETYEKEFIKGNLDLALNAISHVDPQHPMKAYAYESIIREHIRKGNLVKAGAISEQMPESELKRVLLKEVRNLVILETFENALSNKNLEEAFDIVPFLDQQFLVTTLAFEKLIRVLLDNKDVKKALEVLNEMPQGPLKEKLKMEIKEKETKCSIM